MPRRTWLALAAGLFLPLACGLIREDELECEQAVAHLIACCPGFQPNNIACNHESSCGSTTYPSLPLDESKCLEALDCAGVRLGGYCARAQHAVRRHEEDDAPTTQHTSVCP